MAETRNSLFYGRDGRNRRKRRYNISSLRTSDVYMYVRR